uniref:AlNc14C372G11114 protein n=1 Tax=Albugo laibachii Nc14 TaxID=890382 RepID=F0WY54_9STRA|nr:AlNc14C372G11114 [Albugo laibachii Nc14]|eukprot:CCA26405.1 AlNc14C372G11114 [Albugo laibachii Nc14]
MPSPTPPFLVSAILANHVQPASALVHRSLWNMPPPVCAMAHFDCWEASCLTASTTCSPLDNLSSFKVYTSMSKVVLIVSFSRIDGRSDRPKLQFQVCCCELWSKLESDGQFVLLAGERRCLRKSKIASLCFYIRYIIFFFATLRKVQLET